ncbi:MAG: FecCD family ABC transporter permease [Pseudorhodobacter sp.]
MTDHAAILSLPRRIGFRIGVAGIAAAILVLSVVVAVSVGAVAIPLATVWGVALDRALPGLVTPDWGAGRAAIIWEIRFPRVILAGLVGAGLGLVGAALQAVTRNPLADPHLLGISSGGAFGAIAALLHTGLFLGLLTVPLMAFGGALGATVLVLGVARMAGATSADRLILAGVAVSFVIMACANILIFLGDPKATHTVVFWMLGGLGLAQWTHLLWPLTVLMPCGLWLWSQAGRLNAMSLGDETAASLGIEVGRFRLAVFVAAALITGVMVAFSGLIGFVGLMMPHLVRLVLGGDNARVLPASAFAGAVFLIWADAGARVVMAPEDMPIGIVTGLVGGVFFIWMMSRRGVIRPG